LCAAWQACGHERWLRGAVCACLPARLPEHRWARCVELTTRIRACPERSGAAGDVDKQQTQGEQREEAKV
jgi:hypothetical protein